MKWTRREFVAAAGLLGLAGCARVEQSRLGRITPDLEFGKRGPTRFAALNDLHLLDSRSVGIVGRAVNAINNDESIDFVVVLGDLTTHGTLPEINLARLAFERLRAPVHCIPGPHDAIAGAEAPLAYYQRVFEKPQWNMNMGGWTLIGADSSNAGVSDGPMPGENLEWLATQAKRLDPQRPVALCCHHPLGPGAGDARLQNADEVLALFAGQNLRLVASGHAHENRVEEQDGVLFVTTAPCSTTLDGMGEDTAPGYRVFTLEEARIQHEFVPVPL